MISALTIGTAMAEVTCSRKPVPPQAPPSDVHWFVPPDAKNLRKDFGPSGPSMSYSMSAPYPAERIICDVFNDLDEQGWQPLREDFLNPGLPTSAIRGWNELVNGTVKPEMHVHSWASEWLNERGDVMSYMLRYEYPEGTTPIRETVQVVGLNVPAPVLKVMAGSRASQLRSFVMPTRHYTCEPPVWTQYVKDALRDPAPRFTPYELPGVRIISIGDDIGGLAERLAAAIRKARPDLKVGTPEHPVDGDVDARYLHFAVKCVCTKDKKAEFVITEGFLFDSRVDAAPPLAGEPARVLFYWKNGGGDTFADALIAALGQP